MAACMVVPAWILIRARGRPLHRREYPVRGYSGGGGPLVSVGAEPGLRAAPLTDDVMGAGV